MLCAPPMSCPLTFKIVRVLPEIDEHQEIKRLQCWPYFTQSIAPFHRVGTKRSGVQWRTMAHTLLEEHFCSSEIIMIIALAFASTSSQNVHYQEQANMNGSNQPLIEQLRKALE